MYFYASVDESGPHKRHLCRLTGKILKLIPTISLSTNTFPWPLFIVGALGVRPELDKDQNLVSGTLENLQQTRQLGYVRRARNLIEEVWNTRDLYQKDALEGWSILGGTLGHDDFNLAYHMLQPLARR